MYFNEGNAGRDITYYTYIKRQKPHPGEAGQGSFRKIWKKNQGSGITTNLLFK